MQDHPTAPPDQIAALSPASTGVVTIGGARGTAIGGGSFLIVAGPCAVEHPEGLLQVARSVAAAGAGALRGGAYKPRTSPHSFQGLGPAALELLAQAREDTGLPVVTELLDPRDARVVGAVADMVQIGARSMHNVPLLRAAGELGLPILLKRGPGSTIAELLAAADYVLETGNRDIVLCERGIRTFESSTRYTLDIAAIPVLRERTDLPVIVDPSHAAGRRELVPALAAAAVAAGADGLLVEVHDDPAQALSDGQQSMTLDGFAQLVQALDPLLQASGRVRVARPALVV